MDSDSSINIFWFRRDLRLFDNTGLYHALETGLPVLCLFIFDQNILEKLETEDVRVSFIHSQISKLDTTLKDMSSGILTKYGRPLDVWKDIAEKYNVKKVFTNRDYEPYARERDQKISKFLHQKDIGFHTFKDHVIQEPNEVLKSDGTPYTVFTPFSKVWKNNISSKALQSVPSAYCYTNFYSWENNEIIPLNDLGFTNTGIEIPGSELDHEVLANYRDQRDYPSKRSTSRLGIHFRFGTVSIREVAREAFQNSSVYLNELIWREFYQAILWHFPRVVRENFKVKYNAIVWRNNEEEFNTWCHGRTGYPLVDAGMRELNATGFMHNRVRMVVASFLTKHLLIDWRWGEAYFAKRLLDFELASNNGGWQWAAGTGTDAQPYFRIFNPESQTKKFDPELVYIKKWVPEFQELSYPKPIVEHKYARERALSTFKKALNNE